MSSRTFYVVVTIIATTFFIETPTVTAQTNLTSWGKPNLQGVWDFRSLTPMERPENIAGKEVFTEEEAATFSEEFLVRESRDLADAEAEAAETGRVVPYNDFWFDWGQTVTTDRTSLITNPPDGRMPALTNSAMKRRAERQAARRGVGTDEVSPGGWIDELSAPVRCITGFNQGPPMTPSAYNNNMQLFQTADHVVILNEMVHDARIVPLDGRPHIPGQIRQWTGSSRGHWDGNTLVVETVNRRDLSFRGAGQHLYLTERFTRVSDDTLVYEVTLEDPTTWEEPWTFMVPMAKNPGEIYEYACHEGNYYMENMLRGKRAEEEAAQQ
ncbi:MAG: hypothetical protein CMN58_05905 [Solibacterales bacterium]|nr:hypothetical protein [Bryobacterales bacterium]